MKLVDENGNEIKETKESFDSAGNQVLQIVAVEKAGKIGTVNTDGTFRIDFEDASFLGPYTHPGLENPRDANSNEKSYRLLEREDSDPAQQKVYPGRVPAHLITVIDAKFRHRRLKVRLPVDKGSIIADEFFGVVWYVAQCKRLQTA